MRGQGRPKLADEGDSPDVQSDLRGGFDLKQRRLAFSKMHFECLEPPWR